MAKRVPNSLDLLSQFGERMLEELEELSSYGANAEGGVTRLLYTDPWLKAQRAIISKMQLLGLEAGFDAVGNVFGKLLGSQPDKKPVLTGSHIDTVKTGGKYDGAYGVVASMMALGYLKATYGAPKRTLEAVSFCEEEGSRFPLAYWGSGHVTGVRPLRLADEIADSDGVTLLEAMREAGFDATTAGQQYPAKREFIGGYIEIHIEQGSILTYKKKQIGIVTAIVGQIRLTVQVTGSSNHAGTTPMKMRKDALAGAAEMVAITEQMALEAGEPLVATVGRLEVKRGTSNVVPGEVEFTLDIRHTDEPEMRTFCVRLLTRLEEIAMRRGLTIETVENLHAPPVAMQESMAKEIEAACEAGGFQHMRLPSGAGHDAQLFGPICPSAMIFVPSVGGISHSPEEFTEADDLIAGFHTLVHVLYQYGYGGKADETL
ncbi:M20 family metallo-hydrolase [Paenibacillus chondroitinus]|uniref:M20 family metallo-hydrolase n=1 Tax=Paenibacillus chondroitinus TaxID=59842 RepID=A0ABU6DGV6_9BACL|nr:M20 family metallo-hydrolase [Paenibacillus chondroitinus]MCY9661048.1 M20 family metallo-hydrolase [Paenibacillus anseongense]MEB4796771.1 M20 family metallo-hydrolase [Paenibacillus chondroitinus]